MTSVPHLDAIPADLPIEIVILILHETCRSWPSFRLTLSLTCSWARRIALTHLYSIVGNPHSVRLLSKTLQQEAVALRNPPFMPAFHVRGLWLGTSDNQNIVVFTLCRALTHVALLPPVYHRLVKYSSPYLDDESIFEFSVAFAAKPALEILIIDAYRLASWHFSKYVPPPPQQPTPLFAKISRLWIGKMGAYSATAFSLDHFTTLTHFAIPYHRPSRQPLDSLRLLFRYPRLECIVLILVADILDQEQYDEGLKWVAETRTVHPRLLVLPLRHESLQADWERSQLPGESIWERAASFTEGLNVQS